MNFFTIVIPIYNTEKFLSRCLDSVLTQAFTDYEIICVNDKSPGDCKSIIDSKKSNKIKYIENETNLGTHMSRKRAVELADSKYILFLDSDDYYSEKILTKLYQKLEHEDIDQLEFGYITKPYNKKSVFQYIDDQKCVLDKVVEYNVPYVNFSLCNKITKTNILKEAFARMKDFYCVWFEDGYEQFIISSLCQTFRSYKEYFLFLDETAGITTSFESISAQKFGTRCKNVKEVIDNLYDYINQYQLAKYKTVIDKSYYIHSLYLINRYFPTVKQEECLASFELMLKYFPVDLMNSYIYGLSHPMKKAFIVRVKNKIMSLLHL